MHGMQMLRLGLIGLLLFGLAALVGCSGPSPSSALDSPHTLVRKAAVAGIGQTCDPKDFEAVVDLLRNDPDRLVRSQAAFTLGNYSARYYSVGFSPLLDSLQNDPSVFVRSASALSLSSTPDSRAVEPLVSALRDDARGEITLTTDGRVITYRACTADAARTSLEKIVGLEFASTAHEPEAIRIDVAYQWENWYFPRADFFPSQTTYAKQ